MKKMIYIIDNFIINSFKKVEKISLKNNLFVSILGLFLMIIFIIIFALPVLILQFTYLFIDRDQLKKQYKKGAKK